MQPTAMDERSAQFDALFTATQRRVFAYLLRRGTPPTDIDDIVADVYVVVWRRFVDVPRDDPLPWLIGVARNVLRNHQRTRLRDDALLRRLRSEPPRDQAAVDATSNDIAAIRHALADLSEPDRELLQLAAVEELSPAQIGVALGCKAVTARVRLHRARTRLQASLERSATNSKGDGKARAARSGGSRS
jgi:RNA polymerase sigma-70 factor (ECF subfamily)